MVAPPGEVDPLALNVTSSGASPDIGFAVNAAVGTGNEGNVTAGTARHSASALACKTMLLPTIDATISVGAAPTGTLPPSCPTIDFTWVDRHNNGNPHRMDLNATLSPATAGYNYAWSGAFTFVGQSDRAGVTVNFTSGGSQSVAVTATLGGCSVTVTKSVPVP